MELPVNYDKLKQKQRREVREEYVRVQEGLCKHCQNPLTEDPTKEITGTWVKTALFPRGFFNNPVHLHHDHGTGMTIGAIHARCNAVLWQYHGE